MKSEKKVKSSILYFNLKNLTCYGYLDTGVEFVMALDFLNLHTRRRVVVGEK